MKILLVTLHSQNNNYGSVLQANSLYLFLCDLGHDVTILDYQPFYSNGITNLKMLFRKAVSNTIFLPYYVSRTKRFNHFIKYQKLTKRCKRFEELGEVSKSFDLLMIGSDQVWNPTYLCGKDPAYTLQFSSNPNKMSYAASIGTSDITKEQIDVLVNSLRDFKYVSLRENSSAQLLKNNGRRDARYVLDPVFLYGAEHYKSLEATPSESGYILAYIMHKDPFIEEIVQRAAIRYKKKVIQVGGFMSKCKSDVFYRNAGPREFLGLVHNADYVITSSFHGTAFAHIYHKNFLVVMPPSNTLRIVNILQTAGTEDRIAKSVEDVAILDSEINYDQVDTRINLMREYSRDYLTKSLKLMGR
jgi:hypothetical protein